MPRFELDVHGVLFDLDGVLVDSSACLYRAWCEWAAAHGIDGGATYEIGHGLPTLEQIRSVAPRLASPKEAAKIDALEDEYVSEVTALPGAERTLNALAGMRFGIVTSCNLENTRGRLQQAGLPVPDVLVCFGDVAAGKPAPDGYLLGCRRLGLTPAEVAVFEDAPLGVQAAHAAGTCVVGLTTTHALDEIGEADVQIADLSGAAFARALNGTVAVALDVIG